MGSGFSPPYGGKTRMMLGSTGGRMHKRRGGNIIKKIGHYIKRGVHHLKHLYNNNPHVKGLVDSAKNKAYNIGREALRKHFELDGKGVRRRHHKRGKGMRRRHHRFHHGMGVSAIPLGFRP
jgi:hypothetical protein